MNFSAITFKSAIIRMLIGWLVGVTVISFFVFGVPDPDPAWGTYWRIRPLIITPMASAFGALGFYLKDIINPKTNLMHALVFLVSVLGFIIALWLGIVLGLDGTLWN